MRAEEEEIRYCVRTLSPDLTHLELYILSDLHYGNPYCNRKRFAQQIDYIARTPEAYFLVNGDMLESSIRTSVGEIYKQVGTPQEQRDTVIEMLLPAADKCLGMTSGNHEQRITREVGVDLCEDIAKALGCWYDADSLHLVVRFGNRNKGIEGKFWSYDIYAMHGYGGARTKGAKAAKLERMAYWVSADVFAQSHDHDVMTFPAVSLEKDMRFREIGGFTLGLYRARRVQMVKSNAFLRWGGYARRGGFPPSDLVTPTIWLGGAVKPWPGVHGKSGKPEVRVVT